MLGALVSAAAHAAFMAGFVRLSDGELQRARELAAAEASKPREPEILRPPEPSRPEQKEVVVRLGIEHSEAAATMTWLGFAEPTRHEARQAVTEQSPFTLKPGETEAAPVAPPPAPKPQPTLPAQAITPPAPHQAQPAPEARAALDPALSDLGRRLLDTVRQLAKETAAPPPAAPASPSPREAPQQVRSTPAPSQPTPGKPGIASDRESIATALKDAPVVRPGQVVASKGLEIATREARWTITTLMTRRPRNPTVSITFGRDGRVKRADFVSEGGRRYSTGYDDVDQPLLNAIFSWTARGEPLRALPTNDPEAGVTIVLTIVLG